MMKTMTLTCLFLVAACSGGGSSKPAATPVNPDPVPMAEPAPPAPPDPMVEPTAPVAPAPPAPDPAKVKAELLAVETAAFEKAEPVFEKSCAKCHSKGGPKATKKKLGHFDMTSYPFGGHHAMEISGSIRTSLGIDGSKPTMPFDKKGSVKGDELALIAAWADAFDASHKGGAHEGHGAHGHGGGHKH